MTRRIIHDVSDLPTFGFGPRMTTWWGTLGFMTLEGFGFALAIGIYFYLMAVNRQWPLATPPPDLAPGAASLVVLLASAIPNKLLIGWARERDLQKVRTGLLVMAAIGFLFLLIRFFFEFRAFHILWNANAYGSVVWLILGLHTAHVVTDLGDTLVLTALMFTPRGAAGRRFSDVQDNAFYWDFVVLAWVPLYLVLYWAPRL